MFCFGPHASTTPAESMGARPTVDGMFVGEPEDALLALAALDSLDRLRRGAEPDVAARRRPSSPHRAHGVHRLPADAVARRGTCSRSSTTRCRSSTSRTCSSRPAAAAPTPATSASRRSTRATSSASAARRRSSTRSSAAYRELGVEFFYLWGDTVTLNVKSFTAFCDELIARNLPIQWFGNARADNLTDPAFVHRLKRAGCWMLALGIEIGVRGSPQGHGEAARAPEDPDGVQEHARRRHQVVRLLHLRLSRRDARRRWTQTTRYAIELDPDFANFYPAVPYPGHGAVREVRARRLAEARGCRLVEDGVLGTTCCAATVSTSGSSWRRSTAPSGASSCARRTSRVTWATSRGSR